MSTQNRRALYLLRLRELVLGAVVADAHELRLQGNALISNAVEALRDRAVIEAELAMRLALVTLVNALRRGDPASIQEARAGLDRVIRVMESLV